jgi:hypothetical protein
MQERILGIPSQLLRAIALMESGRKNPVTKKLSPWPWTIHVNGKGYYLSSKRAAIEAVQSFRKQGFKNIDVGCMQVNLHHHPNAFRSLEEAFDPQINIAYAAKYLKNLKKQHGNWKNAVEYYHSATPIHGHPYRQRVLTSWKKLSKNHTSYDLLNTDDSGFKYTAMRKKMVKSQPKLSLEEPTNENQGMVQFADLDSEGFDAEQGGSSSGNYDDGHIPLHKMPRHNKIQVKTQYIALTQERGPVYIPLS